MIDTSCNLFPNHIEIGLISSTRCAKNIPRALLQALHFGWGNWATTKKAPDHLKALGASAESHYQEPLRHILVKNY